MYKKGLSIIVPVYNEENGIKNTINGLIALVEDKKDIEIIIVNDGSTDNTAQKLEEIEGKEVKLRVINQQINRGYGAALKIGIKHSSFDYVAITDADETYPNDRIVEFYLQAHSEDIDMIVGSRKGENVTIPLVRKPAKWALNKLANYLAEYQIPDLNSGLRVMRREVVNRFLSIIPDGFSFTTTITLAMITNGYNVQYKSIDYFHRAGNSKIRPVYDTLNFIQLIIRTVLLFRPLKIFLPTSLVMLTVGFALILYRIFIGEAFGVTSIVIFVGGIQLLATGMVADLIDRRLG